MKDNTSELKLNLRFWILVLVILAPLALILWVKDWIQERMSSYARLPKSVVSASTDRAKVKQWLKELQEIENK